MRTRNPVGTILMLAIVFALAMHVQSQSLVEGDVITLSSDTVKHKLRWPQKRAEQTKQRFTALEVSDDRGVHTLYPRDILGYITNGTVFRSLVTPEVSFFMRLEADGPTELYYYPGYVLDEGEVYIFKKKQESEFHMMRTPFRVTKIGGFNSGSFARQNDLLPMIPKEKDFVNFFSDYMKDCPMLVRKIKSEFYTSADVVAIFREYNKNCGGVNVKSSSRIDSSDASGAVDSQVDHAF
ncbi:hypothetical protein [Chryseolinea lacunae]|uniref:DUF4384 domain-containing protein n=1 Tax=Chryseolinea lacunae TaxID=2801331 RepID=A0ABS1KXW9_9BACT|nr:hypothetical protein [Chryseolinea lacunae]MBL0743542.1 hypothetical protein [Chryseolinea lacunae]